MRKILLLLLSLPLLVYAQTGETQDVWVPFRFFVGSWEGVSKGQFGVGAIEREYQFVLKGAFLEVRTKATYKPQEKNPKGEVHEDVGLISFDRNRGKFILRQFHVEGFVNQYVLDTITTDSKSFGFNTESIENLSTSWRARETYKILNKGEFIEIFEVAASGKDFVVYTENHFKRKQ
jgi:hypothetical protein